MFALDSSKPEDTLPGVLHSEYKAVRCFETSVTLYKFTRFNMSCGLNLQQKPCENAKIRKCYNVVCFEMQKLRSYILRVGKANILLGNGET